MSYFYKENKQLEELVDSYFQAIEKYNNTYCNGELSVILLGSLSRGEGSFIETENGIKVLSDIEYFTVYPQGFTGFNDFTKFCKKASKEIFLSQNSTLFHIDNTFVKKSSLPLMERKLITYDAKQMGKTVVGKDAVSLIPEIDLCNINLRDINDILTHRVFSLLYYGLPLKNIGNLEEYRYSLAKNSLDLMTVLLVSKGRIASGFIKRLEIVKELPVDEKVKNYFEYCLSVKLSTDCEFTFSIEEMEEMFLSLVKQLKKEFKVNIKNDFVNFKHVTKRRLGIVKRAIKCKTIPSVKHLSNLIIRFENKDLISKKDKINNLVLNGYPVN